MEITAMSNFPIIYTSGNAAAEAAVFGSIQTPANAPTAAKVLANPIPTPATPKKPRAFEVGKVYATRSICDYDCIYRFVVTRRTDASVWIKKCDFEGKPWKGEKEVRRAISLSWGGEAELIYPNGKYSMCAVLTADKGNIL